jgi:hypothetical protein
MKTITMKLWKYTLVDFSSWDEQPWDYTWANGVIPFFDLWVTHFVITCHHEIIHLLLWKMKLDHEKNISDLEKWSCDHKKFKNYIHNLEKKISWKL